jgi:hypothetical protein
VRRERIQVRTPATDNPRDGKLDPLDEVPEPELLQTMGSVGGGPDARTGGPKEGEIDQLEGQVSVQIDRSQNLQISWSQDNGYPGIEITVGWHETNQVIPKAVVRSFTHHDPRRQLSQVGP